MAARVPRPAGCGAVAASDLHPKRLPNAAAMITALYGPSGATPLLWLGLQKIARTPTARLAVGYRLLPRHVSLGTWWYLDRLLAGGITGEPLPLWTLGARDIRPLVNQRLDAEQFAPPGSFIDVVV